MISEILHWKFSPGEMNGLTITEIPWIRLSSDYGAKYPVRSTMKCVEACE